MAGGDFNLLSDKVWTKLFSLLFNSVHRNERYDITYRFYIP
jgi:hypothetical protein